MHVSKLLVLALALSSTAACTASYGFRGGAYVPPPPPPLRVYVRPAAPAPAPVGGPAGPAVEATPGYVPGDDRHFFAADDYLITRERDDGNTVMVMGKLMDPPSEATKNEAKFLAQSGKEMWTATFYLSRVAEPADFVVGARAFCFGPATYRSSDPGPRDKQDSRAHSWTMGKISDTSDLYRGRVSVGRHSCPAKSVRVPVKQ
jgi:hypothetical protein